MLGRWCWALRGVVILVGGLAELRVGFFLGFFEEEAMGFASLNPSYGLLDL
jgi:hypothetical protein